VAGEAPVFEIYFTDRPITDYRATLSADQALHAAFTREMLTRGVVKAAQKFYVSLVHTEAEVARTLEVFNEALTAVAGTSSH
jgi:glutamate-1-semialdehyde 2,1-aminomutase